MATGSLVTLSWHDFGDKSINIDQWDAAGFVWNADVPYIASPVSPAFGGSLADTAPVEIVHWSATGTLAQDGLMIFWRSCLKPLAHM